MEMDVIEIPIGRSGFADIRKNQYYYVDKSGLIRKILRMDGRQVTLVTRLNEYFAGYRSDRLSDAGTGCAVKGFSA